LIKKKEKYAENAAVKDVQIRVLDALEIIGGVSVPSCPKAGDYRGTSLIRNRAPPRTLHTQ
jgi:hypothetical protein